MSTTKRKDGDDTTEMHLRLKNVLLPFPDWQDEDGQSVWGAALADWSDDVSSAVPSKRARLPLGARTALEALEYLAGHSAGHCQNQNDTEKGRVHIDDWRKEAYARSSADGTDDAKRKAFNRAKTLLLNENLVDVRNDFYWVKP